MTGIGQPKQNSLIYSGLADMPLASRGSEFEGAERNYIIA